MNITYSELKKQRQFMAKFVLVILLMNVFGVVTAYANNTEDWEVCDCNSPTYSLSFTLSPSNYVAEPEKDAYTKGEKVILGYNNENVIDGYWVISPSSHLASGSKYMFLEIYMTDTTEAEYIPTVIGSTRTVTIANYCTTCGDVNPVGVQEVPHGEVIQITASPFGEKIPVWHGKPTGDTVDGGTQRLSEDPEDGNYYLNFHATGNYTLICEWEFPPTGELRTGSVSWVGNGNAMIHTAGYESSHFSPSPFLHNSATTPNSTFDARCIPTPGCYLTHWQWNVGGVTKYRAGTAVVSGSYYTLGEITLQQPQTDFVADVQQGIYLNIVTEGEGVVISDCFQSSWNPKPYYVSENGTVLNELISGNEVIMEASPCSGWGLIHWEIEDTIVEPVPGAPYLIVYMNWWDGDFHVPYGQSAMNVKAVFGRICTDGRNGSNLDRLDMNDGFFASDETKSTAWQESSWRQFNCDGEPLGPGGNSTATGLMQIIQYWWPEGWNNELERNIEFGEMCGSSGYIWCETYNKDLGQDIWNNRRNRAFNEIGVYEPSEEQLLKETASKYYYGPSGEYWNRDYLRETPPQWIPNSGAWVDYANNWYEHYANEPWEDNLVCPCNPGL